MASASEIKERIEAKMRAQAEAREAASVADWEAFEAACEEHGYDSVKQLRLPRYHEGLPTMVLVKAAPEDHLRIFRSRTLKARKDKGGRPDLPTVDRELGVLGKACIVYPSEDLLQEIKTHYPAIEKDAGVVAKDMATVEAEEEGKE